MIRILNEDLNSMKAHYPNISDREFQEYIELDPTYQRGSTQAGKYARWILALAAKGKLDNVGHVPDILTRFEEEKNNLVNKDIMKYKSIDELENMLNDDSSYKTLSHRQEVRSRQKDRKSADLTKDAELVYTGAKYEIWVPHTYAASCKLGQGTKWCTASTESDHYYNSYKNKYKGEYYILINKSDPTEKYQFHFESDQFMDKKDNTIDVVDFLNTNKDIKKFFSKIYPEIEKEELIWDGKTRPSRWVTSVIIPEGKSQIGENAFYRCNITSITIPDSVTSIGREAFSGCSRLTSITIPDSITRIGKSAFYGCESLISITIPDSVTRIEYSTFRYCSNLKSITIPDSITMIGESAFYRCGRLSSVIIPNSVTDIKESAFEECTSLTSMTIPDSVIKVGIFAFTSCTNLTSITLSNRMTRIAENAFYRCTKLNSIIIPDSITHIEAYAFEACSNLSEVIFEGDINDIDISPSAFRRTPYEDRTHESIQVRRAKRILENAGYSIIYDI